MSLLTSWGYTITDVDQLITMLNAGEFGTFTANKYQGDGRIEPNLEAASAAIRNYCGWHVYPEQACSMSERLLNGNGRVKRVGTDILVQIPAAYVTGIEAVTIDGEETEDFDFQTEGLLRIFDVYQHEVTRKTIIAVAYKAGLPDGLISGIKELAAHLVTKALDSSGGVASETAGGVSITYNSTWVNSARATAIQSEGKEILAPYRIREVF